MQHRKHYPPSSTHPYILNKCNLIDWLHCRQNKDKGIPDICQILAIHFHKSMSSYCYIDYNFQRILCIFLSILSLMCIRGSSGQSISDIVAKYYWSNTVELGKCSYIARIMKYFSRGRDYFGRQYNLFIILRMYYKERYILCMWFINQSTLQDIFEGIGFYEDKIQQNKLCMKTCSFNNLGRY